MKNEEGDLGNLDLDDNTIVPRGKKQNPFLPYVITSFALIALLAALAFYFLVLQQSEKPAKVATPTPVPTPVATPTPTAPPTPVPIAQPKKLEPTPEPLPALNTSDDKVRSEITDNLQLTEIAKLLTSEELIRKFVRAAYNLNNGKIVTQYRPISGPDTAFKAQAIGRMAKVASKNDEDGFIKTAVFKNPQKNQQRYNLYAQLAEQLDTDNVLAVYRTYYPLLQQAYGELGEGPKEFHTVILQAIDSFLATPNVDEEPQLILTSVQYQFLDPELEALPNTQKLMLRMGSDNRGRIEEKLKELRGALEGFKP